MEIAGTGHPDPEASAAPPAHHLVFALHERRPDFEIAAVTRLQGLVRAFRSSMPQTAGRSGVLDLAGAHPTFRAYEPSVSLLWGEYDQLVTWLADETGAAHRIASENGTATQDYLLARLPAVLGPDDAEVLALLIDPGARCRPFVLSCLKLGDHWMAAGSKDLLPAVLDEIRRLAPPEVLCLPMTSHSWPDVVVVASVRDQDLAPLVRFIDALEALSGGALGGALRDDADARDVLNQWVGASRGRDDYDDRVPACDLLVHSRHLWAIGGRVDAPAYVDAYLGGRPRLDDQLPVPEVPPKVSGRGWVEARMWIHPRHGHRGRVVAQVGRLEPSPTLRYTFDGTSHALAPAYRVAARADELVSLANFACWLRAALRADVLAISTTLAFDVDLLDQPRPPPLNRGGFDLLRQPARSVEDDRYESERARSHGLGVTESAALLDLVASVRDCMASPPMYGTMLGVYRVVRQIVEDIYRPIGAAPIIAAEARRMLLAEALEAYQQRLQHSAMFFGGARLHDAVPPGVAKVSGWIEVLVGAVFGVAELAGARCVTLVRFGLAEEMAVQSFGRNVVVVRMGMALALQPAAWGLIFHELGHHFVALWEQGGDAEHGIPPGEPYAEAAGEFDADVVWMELGCRGDLLRFTHQLFRAAAMFPADGRRGAAELRGHVQTTVLRAMAQAATVRPSTASRPSRGRQVRELARRYFPDVSLGQKDVYVDPAVVGRLRERRAEIQGRLGDLLGGEGSGEHARRVGRVARVRDVIDAAHDAYVAADAVAPVVRGPDHRFLGPDEPGWYLDLRGRTFVIGAEQRAAMQRVQDAAFAGLDGLLAEERAEHLAEIFAWRRRHPRFPSEHEVELSTRDTARLADWSASGVRLESPVSAEVCSIAGHPVRSLGDGLRYAFTDGRVHPEEHGWT